jgi:hypothetical protein
VHFPSVIHLNQFAFHLWLKFSAISVFVAASASQNLDSNILPQSGKLGMEHSLNVSPFDQFAFQPLLKFFASVVSAKTRMS